MTWEVPDRASPRVISVVIVDDHPLYRTGLAHVLDGVEGVDVVGSVGSVEDYERLGARPDVVLLDLYLPGTRRGEGVARVCRTASAVLVLSAAASPKAAVEAIAAGARGYLTKDADAIEVISALRTVASGLTYVSPTLAGYLLASHSGGSGGPVLSDRERQVLSLVASGETDRGVAAALGVSTHTVRSYLERIRDKTGVRRRAELGALASRLDASGGPHSPSGRAGAGRRSGAESHS